MKKEEVRTIKCRMTGILFLMLITIAVFSNFSFLTYYNYLISDARIPNIFVFCFVFNILISSIGFIYCIKMIINNLIIIKIFDNKFIHYSYLGKREYYFSKLESLSLKGGDKYSLFDRPSLEILFNFDNKKKKKMIYGLPIDRDTVRESYDL